jgi:Lrp/AsnC family leucine-responsive transcriptional regulator
MNRTDKKILEILQTDSSITNQDLAARVNLSPSPCLRRVKQLIDQGYIRKQVALLDGDKVGLNLTVMLLIGLSNHKKSTMSDFEVAIKNIKEITQCYLIAGQSADYLLKVVVKDIAHYQSLLLSKISTLNGVQTFHSSFVMQVLLDTTELPLDYL